MLLIQRPCYLFKVQLEKKLNMLYRLSLVLGTLFCCLLSSKAADALTINEVNRTTDARKYFGRTFSDVSAETATSDGLGMFSEFGEVSYSFAGSSVRQDTTITLVDDYLMGIRGSGRAAARRLSTAGTNGKYLALSELDIDFTVETNAEYVFYSYGLDKTGPSTLLEFSLTNITTGSILHRFFAPTRLRIESGFLAAGNRYNLLAYAQVSRTTRDLFDSDINWNVGFSVIEAPEPTTTALAIAAGLCFLGRRRKR